MVVQLHPFLFFEKFKNNCFFALGLFFASVFCLSPVFGSIFSITGNYISLLFLAFCFLVVRCFRLEMYDVFFILFLLLIGLLNSFYWQKTTFLVLVYFLSAFVLVRQVSRGALVSFVEILSVVFLIFLLLCVLGLGLVLLGVEPFTNFNNPDGRVNYVFFGTFSNTYVDDFIRPSAFLDEPGALSFLVCFTVAFRETLSLDRKMSFFLLYFGLVTSSLAHIVFCFFYLIHIFLRRPVNTPYSYSFGKPYFKFIGLTFLLLLFYELFYIFSFIFDRFMVEDSAMSPVGARQLLTQNALHYLDIKSFFLGIYGDMLNASPEDSLNYLSFGENPLSLLVYYGISLSLPYYIVIGFLLYTAFVKKDFVILGIFLLLLQRPYVMSFGYALIILLFVQSVWFLYRKDDADDKTFC